MQLTAHANCRLPNSGGRHHVVIAGSKRAAQRRCNAIVLTSENNSFAETVSAVWFAKLRPKSMKGQELLNLPHVLNKWLLNPYLAALFLKKCSAGHSVI